MQVILLERVRNLGDLGDRVNVRAGYGRNFLFPQSKAIAATKNNIKVFEQRRDELEKKAQDTLDAANARAEKLQGLSVNIEAMASDEGKLYGSIATREIMEAIKAAGHDIEKREVIMPDGALHNVGEYEIALLLHSDVTTMVKVIIGAKA